jgi:hypothetical protein
MTEALRMDVTLEAWAAGSHFLNEDGSVTRWFHGTDIDDQFNIFARCDDASLGFHFGTADAANDRLKQIECLADGGSIIPVYCRAANPLVLSDLFTWSQWDVASALCDAGVLTEDEAEFVADSASAEMIYAAIEEAGYDSVLYGNLCEARDSGQESLMVWRAALVKGVNSASFDWEDPRILSQLPATQDEMSWYGYREREIDSCREELRALRASSPVPA